MAIFSGPYEVIESGSVIQFPGQPLRLAPALNGSFVVIFEFQDDVVSTTPAEPTTNVNVVQPTPPVVRFLMRNFRNPLGIGNIEPIRLGMVAGRALFISYRVYHLDNASKTLDYTFYLAAAGA